MLLVAITLSCSSAALAKSANPNLVPGNTAYVLSIPDVPAFWSAWKANSIYTTFKKVMASPEMAPTMEGFSQQLKTIESALGFPLNGESMSQIFQSLDLYARPGDTAGSVVTGSIPADVIAAGNPARVIKAVQ